MPRNTDDYDEMIDDYEEMEQQDLEGEDLSLRGRIRSALSVWIDKDPDDGGEDGEEQ